MKPHAVVRSFIVNWICLIQRISETASRTKSPGGQLQRAMTAMAMGCDPRLIIFDEPTTALDVTTQIEVLSTIKEAVRAQGVAAIYITHDLAVVAQLADRIMVLQFGDLVEEGDARSLLENPSRNTPNACWQSDPCAKKRCDKEG